MTAQVLNKKGLSNDDWLHVNDMIDFLKVNPQALKKGNPRNEIVRVVVDLANRMILAHLV